MRKLILIWALSTLVAQAQPSVKLCDTIVGKEGPTEYPQMAVKCGQIHQGDWRVVPGKRNWIYVWVDFKPAWPETYPSFRFQVNQVGEDGSETDWTHPDVNIADPQHAVDGFGIPPNPGKYSLRLINKRDDSVVAGPLYFTVAP